MNEEEPELWLNMKSSKMSELHSCEQGWAGRSPCWFWALWLWFWVPWSSSSTFTPTGDATYTETHHMQSLGFFPALCLIIHTLKNNYSYISGMVVKFKHLWDLDCKVKPSKLITGCTSFVWDIILLCEETRNRLVFFVSVVKEKEGGVCSQVLHSEAWCQCSRLTGSQRKSPADWARHAPPPLLAHITTWRNPDRVEGWQRDPAVRSLNVLLPWLQTLLKRFVFRVDDMLTLRADEQLKHRLVF